MTAQRTKARGRGRGGKGLLPPNPRQWDAEHNALDLRDELCLAPDEPLSVNAAFSVMHKVRVTALRDIPVAKCFLDHLRGRGAREWSGAAIPLDGGEVLVVYNDSHSKTRIRATLMEELFHLRLGHPPSTIRLLSDGEPRRTYDADVEREAYASGAAALVPYFALRQAIQRSDTAAAIARRLNVSLALVHFRLKVTRQWARSVRHRSTASKAS